MLWLALSCASNVAQLERVSLDSPDTTNADAVRRAFEVQGMLEITDAVPSCVVTAMMESARAFFALPANRKAQFTRPAHTAPRSYGSITTPGGFAYEVQQQTADGDIINEWLYVKNSSVPFDEHDTTYYASDEGREFYTPERTHPAQQAWPEEVPGLREAVAAYYRAMERLAQRMHTLFAVSLGLDADHFTARARRAPFWPVTIAHYPPQRAAPTNGTMRIQPHWDRVLFSLITSSDAGNPPPQDEHDGRLQVPQVERNLALTSLYMPPRAQSAIRTLTTQRHPSPPCESRC
jgi:isopenicillin N synthase-like dioxygenase